MAIEKVKRTWFLVERYELDTLIRVLADSRTTHVVDLREGAPDLPFKVSAPAEHPGAADAHDRVRKLSRVLDILGELAPPKRAFHENFVNLPVDMTRTEFDHSVAEIDVDRIHDRAVALQRAYAAARKRADELRARIAELQPWVGANAAPSELRRCGAEVGTVSAQVWPRLETAVRGVEELAVERLASKGGRVLVAAAWTNECGREARNLLAAHGFQPLNVEAGAGRISEVVDAARAELAEAEKRVEASKAGVAELAEARRKLIAALAHWEAELERSEASRKAVASKRIAILSGYVRVREMRKLEELLGREFPDVGLVVEDPKPGEDVPVSLGGSKFFAPAQFLTSMFGLPDYFGFDPSPYIFFTFLVFFGLCFGDVVYGLMLLGMGWWLARKSVNYRSLATFFRLLSLCGFSSMVVGALTGSWAADLFTGGYVGRAPASLAERLTIIDPLKRTIVLLGIVLAIGMCNQFYGVLLLMYREWRKRDYFAALCDGGLWLVFLPGLLLLLAAAAADLPSTWSNIGLWMAILGGAGLVLTQGRRERTFLAKAITGLVSLYGILGTYGATSFIGDTLSYSRLLALGLTTMIVGMSFNIIAVVIPEVLAQLVMALAQLLPFASGAIRFAARFLELPAVALCLSVLIAVFGHVFNFLISVLGGFVHSARLIFVEFFTKFYQGGARPFAPLGTPRTVRIVDDEEP